MGRTVAEALVIVLTAAERPQERRGAVIRLLGTLTKTDLSGVTKMDKAKSFSISRRLVMHAYQKVRSNKGAGGVDGMSLEEFDKDYRNHLYKLWNRMSSGSYMLPPVRLVEIPKKGGGLRPLGITTVSDRIGQTVVRGLLEPKLEQVFHSNSYGCRPGRSAIQAVAMARARCWKMSWVIDLDIKSFYDDVPHDLLMKAVRRHCTSSWMLLYIERWLKASLQKVDGTVVERTKGIPQGSIIGPVLANLYLHYCIDRWLDIEFPYCAFERYMDDCIIHVDSQNKGMIIMKALEERLRECGLQLHPTKTKLVYCRDSNRKKKGDYNVSFDFLGYAFKPRLAQNSQRGEWFTNWLPAVSTKSKRSMSDKLGRCTSLWTPTGSLQAIARQINPLLIGWTHYYGKFYVTELKKFMHLVNVKVANWARRKYKNLRPSMMKAMQWLHRISVRSPGLFAHWSLLDCRPTN